MAIRELLSILFLFNGIMLTIIALALHNHLHQKKHLLFTKKIILMILAFISFIGVFLFSTPKNYQSFEKFVTDRRETITRELS